ncbi:uncharacterized protein LOC143197679 isoform X1 [Rhynchophorus ferrugineus]|uniref:uncharacterized protein LOC143197679 isoform X1 n=1 Tax=Rhynchophorus ferrugineus TaxID=354439 RepID=UPI003FCC3178
MESKARKKYVSCRLTPSQESGRIRWCVGHEKTWQSCLKRLVVLPIVLIPVVVVIILVTKYNLGNNGSLTIHLDENNRKNESFLEEIETRQKRQILREERFSYLFKRCYKLYVTFHSEKESFADATNNREPKPDYIDEYPRYFTRKSATFPGENQGKHRQLRKCLEKFRARGRSVDIFQQNNYRKRYKRNSTNDGKTSQTNSQFVKLKNDASNVTIQKNKLDEVKYQSRN